VEKPEGRLGRRRRRCEDNIKMDFHAVGWGGGVDRFYVVYDRDRGGALVKGGRVFLVP